MRVGKLASGNASLPVGNRLTQQSRKDVRAQTNNRAEPADLSGLESFSFGGYRSFGPIAHRFGPVAKVNLVAGTNNSGKSNVLSFLTKHYAAACQALRGQKPRDWVFDPLDRPLEASDGSLWFGLGIPLGSERHVALRKHSGIMRRLGDKTPDIVDKLLDGLADSSGVAWFDYRAPSAGADLQLFVPEEAKGVLHRNEWQQLFYGLTSGSGGALEAWIAETLRALTPHPHMEPHVALVEAVRRVGDAGHGPEGYSGVGVIDRLAQLQNPAYDQQDQKQRFATINAFLQYVLGDDTATLEVPYARDTILVHQGGRTLPLTRLGTGVHEVVILAAAATVLEKHIVCIEEPELHLHPTLQRKLVEYLLADTDNSYFISTHSAHLLDVDQASVFHVTHDGKHSSASVVSTDHERFALCRTLGYRASDLLQANCVVWVEGPSDRIYLRAWLGQTAPDLQEGLHYSIMFYGGRLLSHLTANDPEVTEFISLRRLNRHVVVVMDSDKTRAAATVNATKARVRDEIQAGGGVAWITEGREIENYVDPQALADAITHVQPNATGIPVSNRYHRALRYYNAQGRIQDRIDKVKVARRVADAPGSLEQLDLRERLDEVVQYVRMANGDDTGVCALTSSSC